MCMMSVGSDEINYIVYRYIQESGYHHSAYLFGTESRLFDASGLDTAEVPPAALITMLHKGMLYTEAELCASDDVMEAKMLTEPLTLIEALAPNCSTAQAKITSAPTPSSNKHKKIKHEPMDTDQKPLKNDKDLSPSTSKGFVNGDSKVKLANGPSSNHMKHPKYHHDGGPSAKKAREDTPTSSKENHKSHLSVSNNENVYKIGRDKVTYLKGHESEVFICSWNPREDILASGSGDSTARIWNLSGAQPKSITLKHCIQKDEKLVPSNKDVTSLDWNCTGDMLATGSYDGYARVWLPTGESKNVLGAHKGPIFALKWNKRGEYILSAGVDKSTIVWDPRTGKQIQQFAFHEAPALDVDWKSDDVFASCSTDKKIHVCKIGVDKPIKTFVGHENEVNAIKWDPVGQTLASCSDDMTMKIWNMNSNTCVHNLKAHKKEIYTIKWSPKGRILASASFDTTVRLWDVERGACVQHLRMHRDPVYSVGFSPDGKNVASGSFDKSVHLWDVNNGSTVATYKGGDSDGGIFEVCWNQRGDKVAASTSDGVVIVLDVRFLKEKLI